MKRPAGGTITTLTFESAALERVLEIPVYLPESYFHQPGRRYPVIYLLHGFGARGATLLNTELWSEPLKKRLDRLTIESIVVMPDCSTALGGSQYLNSIANGNYEDHLVKELVRYMDKHYRTMPHPGARALVGKSSGGYGALVQGMKHPDVFGLVACHSADMYFELCYKPDFVAYLREIRPFRNAAGFLREFRKRPDKAPDPIINVIAMASCYSPRKGNPPFALPFDEMTGELRADVWKEWLRLDPVHMVERYARNLRKLRLLYFDCGSRDEYNLHFGARILAARLEKLRVRFRYEEFPGGHRNLAFRYDRSFGLISKTFLITAASRRKI